LKASLLASLLLHATFFAALGRFGSAPAEAPVAGGGGMGGIEVRIRTEDGRTTSTAEHAEDAEEHRGARTEPSAVAAALPEPAASAQALIPVPAPASASESASVSVPVPVPVPAPATAFASASGSASGAESASASGSATASPPDSVSSSAPPGPVAAVLDGAGIPAPRYPPSCRRLGHAGTAIVRVEVREDCRPGRVELIQSAGCAELDRSALDALRRARFRPAQSFGRPVASFLEQRVRFQLR